MNRLIIIGNGFDLAHNLKTSYPSFINWYLEKRTKVLYELDALTSNDALISFTIVTESTESWKTFLNKEYTQKKILLSCPKTGYPLIEALSKIKAGINVEISPLLARIMKSMNTKGWVDIENDYYALLKEKAFDPNKYDYTVKDINKQLECLTKELLNYLEYIQSQNTFNPFVENNFYNCINPEEISQEGKSKINVSEEDWQCPSTKPWMPERVLILDFNYTNTSHKYKRTIPETNIIHIHGDLKHRDQIIFGYGDEIDEDYKRIQNLNDNDLLQHVKSIRYLESGNYRAMLEFIESCPFQVVIMGHSCGISDRTLLNTIFEHKNCVSIKPYYYVKDDDSTNYLELAQNISRNFIDMKLYRDRVVNKKLCEEI